MKIGVMVYTLLFGIKVFVDEFGNLYYKSKKQSLTKKEKRWVIYNGKVEASKVPPYMKAWLDFVVDEPLTNAKIYNWQKSYILNLSGTKIAYKYKNTSKKSINSYSKWSE
jgi:NADH:ubiquinone oxidoreductase subunit